MKMNMVRKSLHVLLFLAIICQAALLVLEIGCLGTVVLMLTGKLNPGFVASLIVGVTTVLVGVSVVVVTAGIFDLAVYLVDKHI